MTLLSVRGLHVRYTIASRLKAAVAGLANRHVDAVHRHRAAIDRTALDPEGPDGDRLGRIFLLDLRQLTGQRR